ncbi:MAG: ribonuclease Z [Maricaulaceae bacterium]
MFGLYFFGTSSGVPTRDRNVSGAAVKLPNSKSWILVDCGEGTQHQIHKSPLSVMSLKAICITHVHGDHCYGLPGLIASNGMLGRKEPLIIISPKGVEDMYLAVKAATDLHTPFEVIFIETETIGAYEIDGVTIEAAPLSHRVPSHAFSFTATSEKRSLRKNDLLDAGIESGPLWGQLQRGEDVTLADGRVLKSADYTDIEKSRACVIVAGDNDTPSALADMAKGTDVLVHEATYTEDVLLKVGPEPQHSSAKRVAEFAQKVKIPNLILTHFSPRFQRDENAPTHIGQIKTEAECFYTGRLALANDHDEFDLLASGELVLKPNQ